MDSLPAAVAIDEVQRAPALLSAINVAWTRIVAQGAATTSPFRDCAKTMDVAERILAYAAQASD